MSDINLPLPYKRPRTWLYACSEAGTRQCSLLNCSRCCSIVDWNGKSFLGNITNLITFCDMFEGRTLYWRSHYEPHPCQWEWHEPPAVMLLRMCLCMRQSLSKHSVILEKHPIYLQCFLWPSVKGGECWTETKCLVTGLPSIVHPKHGVRANLTICMFLIWRTLDLTKTWQHRTRGHKLSVSTTYSLKNANWRNSAWYVSLRTKLLFVFNM